QLSNFLPRLTTGWQFNSLYTFSGGSPINILAGTNVSLTSENKDRANVVPNIPVFADRVRMVTGSSQTYQYINKAAFSFPAADCGCYGNVGRESVYGPGLGAVDFSVFKHTPISENVMTEFRVEIYNIANQANFANPSGTVSSSSF